MKEKLQQIITLNVNNRKYEFPIGDGVHDMPYSEKLVCTLRDRLNLTGAKLGCEQGACGCCTVIMDGKAVTSCMILTVDCEGKNITTIEGLANQESGALNGLQQSFLDNCGYQCGFCTPGIIMSAQALLEEKENPTEAEVRDALAGNFCRCGTHYTAVNAVMSYVEQRREAK